MAKSDRLVVKDDSGRALYLVRWPATYWEYVDCDRGQVIALVPLKDDDRLLRIEYLVPVTSTDRPFPCRVCSARFIDQKALANHGEKRHRERALDPDSPEAIRRLERDQRRLEQEVPLNLDKTEANRGTARA